MVYVWAVEQGSYSDYHVIGVFSSHKNAQIVADAINVETYEPATVARWTLDPGVAELRQGFHQHQVLMLRDGTVEKCEARNLSPYEPAGDVSIWRRSDAPAYKGTGIQDVMTAVIWARDVEHAIKVANELRAELIASGKWRA